MRQKTDATAEPEATGRYLGEIGHSQLLSAEAERDLGLAKEQGSAAARRELIQRNLRLVVAIAKKYQGRGLDLDDLIQEGNIGLVRAVDGFDPKLGYRFSTYGFWWIKQAILRAIDQDGRSIRVPASRLAELRHLSRASARLEEELGRVPTDRELGQELGLTEQQIEQLRLSTAEAVSLEQPVGEDGESELGDVVMDPGAVDPENRTEQTFRDQEVRDALETLPDRQRQVLALRYGLGTGSEPRTLEAVGEELHLSRERVRQLEARGLRSLRATRSLHDFAA